MSHSAQQQGRIVQQRKKHAQAEDRTADLRNQRIPRKINEEQTAQRVHHHGVSPKRVLPRAVQSKININDHQSTPGVTQEGEAET